MTGEKIVQQKNGAANARAHHTLPSFKTRNKARAAGLTLTAALATMAFVAPVSAQSAANTVIAKIPGFSIPTGIVVDSARGKVYVANLGGQNVLVINEATNAVIATIPTLNSVFDMALDPLQGKVYAANYGYTARSVVQVIDERTDTISATIPMPITSSVLGIAVDPFHHKVYAALLSGSLAVIDERTNTVSKTIALPLTALKVGIDPIRQIVYATIGASATNGPFYAEVIDEKTDTVTGQIPLPSQSLGVTVDADQGLVYVGNSGGVGSSSEGYPSTYGTVSIIDEKLNAVTAMIPTGLPGFGVGDAVTEQIALDPLNGTGYATNFYGGTVAVVDLKTNRVSDTIALSSNPGNYGVGIDPILRRVYVGNFDGNVYVISAGERNSPPFDKPVHDWAWFQANGGH